ncbi:MAG: hypothetical protein PGN13_01715 [Patulibacter minatonensis]
MTPGPDLAVTEDAPTGQSAPVVVQVFDGTEASPVDPIDVRAAGDQLADLRLEGTIDVASETLEWALTDGSGTPTGLDELSLGHRMSALSSNGLRALRAQLSGVPATGKVSADSGLDVTSASGEIGSVAVVASSVATDLPPTATAPAVTRTATATTVVDEDVSHVDVDGTTITRSGAPNTDLAFSLAAPTSLPGSPALSGSLTGLPASAIVDLDFSGAGTAASPQRVAFTGRTAGGAAAGLDALSFTATGTDGVLGRGETVTGQLDGLPGDVALDASYANGKATLDAHTLGGAAATIDAVELGAAATAAGVAYPSEGASAREGVYLRDVTGDPFVLGIRATDLTHLESTFGVETAVKTTTARAPLVIDGATDAATGRLVAGSGGSLPDLDVRADLAAGKLLGTAGAPYGQLSVDYGLTSPGTLGATNVQAVASDLGPTVGIDVKARRHATSGALTGIDVTSAQSVSVRLALGGGATPPTLPGTGTSNTLALDGDASGLGSLTARLNKVRAVSLEPQAGLLGATFTTSAAFTVDAQLAELSGSGAAVGTATTTLDATVTSVPAQFALTVAPRSAGAGGGAQLDWSATAAANQVTVDWAGPELITGVGSLRADLRGVPASVTTVLQVPSASAPLLKTTMSPSGELAELLLAAGAGVLPTTGSSTDRITYREGAEKAIDMKLTGLRSASFDANPLSLTLDQNLAMTKPVALDVSVPSGVLTHTLTGLLNKPRGHTELTLTPNADAVPGDSTAKVLFSMENGTASSESMASLSLSYTNAIDGSPNGSLSLTNVPHTFTGCIAGDASCVSSAAADLPAAFSTWNPSDACTPKPQSPSTSFLRRPYAPQGSFAFDDAGTSGTSSQLTTMVTINANLSSAGSGGPTILNNLRVHTLRGDFGLGGTSFTFKPIVSISAGEVPRVYTQFDSKATPFVINDLRGVGVMAKLVLGTDANPAKGNRRHTWTPGAVRSSILGCGVGQNISTQASGALNCGGAKEMQMQTTLGTLNLFNLPLFGDVLGICGGTV